MPKAAKRISFLDLADEVRREGEFTDTKYVVTVRRELMSRIEAALRTAAQTTEATPDQPPPVDEALAALFAGASAASIGTLAAAGIPTSDDPAFALIAAHRAAEIAHCEVIDAQNEAEAKYGIRSVEAWEAADRSGAMCDEVNAICWKLSNTQPTTLAGVAAVLRFGNEVEDAGLEWPETDTIGPEGWHYQLRATMAEAVEALIEAQAGKAVRS
jgi:hypothetical protein